MNRLFKFQLLTAALILALVLSGCSLTGTAKTTGPTTGSGALPTSSQTGGISPTEGGSSLASAVNLMADYQGKGWETAAAENPDAKTLNGLRHFSADLFAEAAKNKGNIMVSPVSVFLALSMTLNGSDNETRDAMLATLAGQGITSEMINQVSQTIIANLTKTGGRTTVETANSIWLRAGFQANPDFLQTNADYYRAGATSLDFADPAAADVINGWVDTNTHGLIKKIVGKINPTTVMFLINTLYFKADWQQPFLDQDTRKRSFTAPAGKVEADFMHQTGKLNYFSGSISGNNNANGATGSANEVAGIALPYDDGRFTYFAVLTDPAVSPRDWLQTREQAGFFTELGQKRLQQRQ